MTIKNCKQYKTLKKKNYEQTKRKTKKTRERLTLSKEKFKIKIMYQIAKRDQHTIATSTQGVLGKSGNVINTVHVPGNK